MKPSHSLEANMLLNALNRILSLLFPLITFPYSTRVLGVENMGRFEFSNSVMGYFSLIAALGISGYAVREGAKLRSRAGEFRHFSDQIFTISVLSAISACVLLGLSCLCVPLLKSYVPFLSVLAVNLLFSALGVEWLYNVFEDYTYITLRNLMLRTGSLILLFVFVRTRDDLLPYTAVSVFAGVACGLLNYRHARIYHRPRLCTLKSIDFRRHMPPIFVLFAMSIATTIYVNSDVTLLGIFLGDYSVGIYAVATRLYSTMKVLLSALIMASIPHLSALLGESRQELFRQKASLVYAMLCSLLFPLLVGMLVLRREMVLLIAGEAFLSAVAPLGILCGALLFSICGWFWGHCVLIPMNRERTVLYATAAGALGNILLNLFLIPLWGISAAALTTLIAEAIQCISTLLAGRKHLKPEGIGRCLWKTLIGCAVIPFVDLMVRSFHLGYVGHTLVVVAISIPAYLVSQYILKNKAVLVLLFLDARKALL